MVIDGTREGQNRIIVVWHEAKSIINLTFSTGGPQKGRKMSEE